MLVNLASQEYAAAVDFASLAPSVRVVSAVFKDDGRVKAVYAKRARGLMCRYIIQRRITSIADLEGFNEEGYKFDKRQSNDKQLVFCRTGGMQRSMAQRATTKGATAASGKRGRAASLKNLKGGKDDKKDASGSTRHTKRARGNRASVPSTTSDVSTLKTGLGSSASNRAARARRRAEQGD